MQLIPVEKNAKPGAESLSPEPHRSAGRLVDQRAANPEYSGVDQFVLARV